MSHDKKHVINNSDNHEGVPSAVEDSLISFDGNGLPKDSNILSEQVTIKLLSDITYYIAIDGSDENDGLTTETPFATVTHALSLLPKNLNGFTVNIYLKDSLLYIEDITVSGFFSGTLNISSINGVDAVLITSTNICISFYNNKAELSLTGISIKLNADDTACIAINNSNVGLSNLKLGNSGNNNTKGISNTGGFVTIDDINNIDSNKVSMGIELFKPGVIFYDAIGTWADTFLDPDFTGLFLDSAHIVKADYEDAVAKKHTQNTDTGTTESSFEINSSGNSVRINTNAVESGGIDLEGVDLKDAVDKKHSHTNQSDLDLVSGTNTGDETQISIINKIGYTPEDVANKITVFESGVTDDQYPSAKLVQDSLDGKLDSETDPIVGSITGIIKSDGAGNISAAIEGTDFVKGNVQTVGDIYAQNINQNEGLLTEPTITDAVGINISVTSCTACLRDTSDWTGGQLKYYTIPENTSLSVTDDSVNYLVIDNSSTPGTPVYLCTTNRDLINNSNYIPVARLYITSGNIEYKIMYGFLGNSVAIRNLDRVMRTRGIGGIERESGLAISETATRVVNLTLGKVWFGMKRISLDAIVQGESGIESELWYHSSGNWTKSDVTAYDNTYYDNGTDKLELTTNRYAVNWIFRNADTNEIDIVLGTGNYTLAQAEASQIPVLPTQITNFYVLCGRIIIKKGASSATSIQTVTNTIFTQAATTDHSDLSNLTWSTSGHSIDSDIAMATNQITGLGTPDANGEAIRATTKITEVNLEDAIDKKHSSNTDTKIITGNTEVVTTDTGADGKVEIKPEGTVEGTFDANGLTLKTGASVNEFSIDGTMAGNSDDAVPTEKAVKTYVASQRSDFLIIQVFS